MPSSSESKARSGLASIRSRTSFGQLAFVRAQVALQLLQVGLARVERAEAAQPQLDPRHPQLGEQLGQQPDRLGVGERRVGADRLDAELVELAVAARLRALVAEEGADVGELHRLRQLLHAVLDVGAADRRRALGSQGEAAPALVLEGEHLLADDVGRVADAALEQLGVLEARRGDRLVAGAGEDRRARCARSARACAPPRAARRRSRVELGTCVPPQCRDLTCAGCRRRLARELGEERVGRALGAQCGHAHVARDRPSSPPSGSRAGRWIDWIRVGPSPPGRSTRPTEPWKSTSPEKIASSSRTA